MRAWLQPHLLNRASRWRLWLRSAVAVSTTDDGKRADELQPESADEAGRGKVTASKMTVATRAGLLFCSIRVCRQSKPSPVKPAQLNGSGWMGGKRADNLQDINLSSGRISIQTTPLNPVNNGRV